MNTKLAIVLLVALVASLAYSQTTTADPTTSAPTTTPEPSCFKFDTAQYGAVKPIIAASTVGSSITLAVTMNRQSLDNTVTPVFHSIDTTPAYTGVCHTTNDGTIGDGTWTSSTSFCAVTYTLTQTLSEVVDTNSSWVMTLASDGRSIIYALPIYTTYSINDNGDCYYVSYRYTVSFRTVLNVVSNSSEYVTSDLSVKFKFSGLKITPANYLEIAGTIIPQIPTFDLRNITMYKVAGNINIPTPTTSCNVYPSGCAQTYSVAIADLGGAGVDITGQYNTVINVYENDVLTRPGVNISYSLSYTIPSDPTVVDTETITTSVGLYTDSSYSTLRTTAYASAVNSLYLENAITATSPAIPSTLKLRMEEGYLCCVNFATSILPYDPNTGTGGCKDATGKLEWVSLGNETIHPVGVSLVSATSGTPKRYRVQVALNQVYSTIAHTSPMTCEVLLISKLEGPTARRVMGASNIGSDYVSTVPFSIAAYAATSTIAPQTTPIVQSTSTVVPSTIAVVQKVPTASSASAACVSFAMVLFSYIFLL